MGAGRAAILDEQRLEPGFGRCALSDVLERTILAAIDDDHDLRRRRIREQGIDDPR
jgi:hypothetical protein